MDQYTGTPLELEDLEVYKESYLELTPNKMVYKIHGRLKENRPKVCPCCQYQKIVSKGPRKVILKHICSTKLQILVEVEYTRWECKICRKSLKPKIPFKNRHYRMTNYCYLNIKNLLNVGGTVSRIAIETGTNRNIVKSIDKRRLKNLARDMKPRHHSKFICVDEFSLHKNHEYATLVIDYCTGESLFVTQGKTYGQMLEFFSFVGDKFMKQVVAVSMDMNASYAKAFKELYPHIKIVYDGFHLIKNYNDLVLTEIRRSEQRRLLEEMDKAKAEKDLLRFREIKEEYKLFKGSRYLILGNKKSLELKDAATREHNRILFEKYEKRGLKLPIGKHYWLGNSINRLEKVLAANEKLQVTHTMGEMLKNSLSCNNDKDFDDGFRLWIKMARTSGIKELHDFCDLIIRHWSGIRNKVDYNISNGPIEGTNCLIKNIRRQSYGIRDDEYFFLKIWEATRKNIKHRTVA